MAVRAKKIVASALLKKGFKQGEGDHHWFIYYTRDGVRTTVSTKTSHGSTKDLGDHLLKAMARQVKLPTSSFLDLVACPLTRDEYEDLLKQGDHI